MKLKNALLTVSTLLIVQSAFVGAAPTCSTTSCSGPAQELVTQMFVYGGNGLRELRVNSAIAVNAWNCTTANNVLIMDDTNVAFEENYALLLAAMINNSNIVLKLDTLNAPASCVLREARLIR